MHKKEIKFDKQPRKFTRISDGSVLATQSLARRNYRFLGWGYRVNRPSLSYSENASDDPRTTMRLIADARHKTPLVALYSR